MAISKKDIKLAEIENRAILAEQVIDNPVFQQSFDAIRASIYHNLEHTKFNQVAERDECWRKLQVLGQLKKQIESSMREAKLKQSNKRKLF